MLTAGSTSATFPDEDPGRLMRADFHTGQMSSTRAMRDVGVCHPGKIPKHPTHKPSPFAPATRGVASTAGGLGTSTRHTSIDPGGLPGRSTSPSVRLAGERGGCAACLTRRHTAADDMTASDDELLYDDVDDDGVQVEIEDAPVPAAHPPVSAPLPGAAPSEDPGGAVEETEAGEVAAGGPEVVAAADAADRPADAHGRTDEAKKGGGATTAGGIDASAGAATGAAGAPAGPKSPTSVYISGLTWWTTDVEIETYCVEYGRVKSTTFFADKSNGKSKGTVCVEFEDAAAAAACNEKLPYKRIHGRDLTVKFAPVVAVTKPRQGGGEGGEGAAPSPPPPAGPPPDTAWKGPVPGMGGGGGQYNPHMDQYAQQQQMLMQQQRMMMMQQQRMMMGMGGMGNMGIGMGGMAGMNPSMMRMGGMGGRAGGGGDKDGNANPKRQRQN